MGDSDLLLEWQALLERRSTFRAPLAPYEPILAAWARWPEDRLRPLEWPSGDCRGCWQRGVPLLAEAPPPATAEMMEDLLDPALEFLAVAGSEGETLQRLADAWDRGEVGPSAFFPERGRIGAASVQARTGLAQESLGFLAYASLRPLLERYFVACRSHLSDDAWDLGVCPFCGAPPGFTDLLEGGQRRLACHVCGGGWVFPRLRCPYCGSQDAKDFRRLLAEETEEGYAIFACKACQGYLKELDRRARWNVGGALVEDWGSPHLDLVAQREGYWRAVPTLIQLEHPG